MRIQHQSQAPSLTRWLKAMGRCCWLLCVGVLLLTAQPGRANPAAAETGAPGAAQRQAIHVVSDDNFPPYLFRNADGQVEGYLVDLWQLFEEKTGIKVTLTATNWANAQSMIQARQADVIDLIFQTPGREALYEFSKPYADSPSSLFTHASISGIYGIQTLKGFQIGVQAGDACIEQLKSQGIHSLLTYPNYATLIAAARSQEVKIFCMDESPANFYLYQTGSQHEFLKSFVLYTGQFHRAVPKGEVALLRQIEAGMQEISAADIAELNEKWLGARLHYSPYGRYLGWGMLVLLATGLLLGGWNMVLRRVVTSKTAALAKALKDLKTANDTTREVNDQLTATLEAIPDMLLRVDQKGCLLEVFASKEDGVRTLPYGEVGKSFSELLPAEAAQTLADAIDAAASSGSDYGRVLALTIAGQPRWFELSTALKRSSEGKPPQFLILSRDITMRRQSELELIRMKEAALEAEKNKQFRLLFDSAPVAMVYLHGQVIESVNQCFTALFGYEEGDISTLQDWWLRAYPDTSYRASVQTQWAQAVEQAMLAQGMVQAQEYQVSCKDGQRLTMLIGGQMVDNGMIVTLTDISQLKQVQRQLDLARTAAQAANAAKSAFLANMSHEIRTPMNAIVGMAHQMRRVGLPTHQGERLDKIDTAAQHLLMVISDILDISKIESGKLVLEQTPVDLVALLDNVKTMSMARASSKGLSLGIETDTLPDKLLGDLTRLQQCLLNYVGNAIKFTDHGSITLKVHVVEETTQTVLLRFEVTDTGPGIPADVLSRLFGAFVQADSSITRRYGGTGLGLSINRLLAELMGGEADAISTPGTGSTFWFTARLTKSSEPVVMLPQAPLVDADAIIRREYSGSRILVVDDEPTNQAVLEFLLQDAGLHVDLADDGFQAVAKARASTYAAIFMDMQMPGLDGLDATRQIRALPTHTRTPILAMTGNAFEEDRLSCLAAGMNDFLTKPVMPKQLFAALLKALEQDTV